MAASLPRLTYCSNVHAGPDLASQLATLGEFTQPIARLAASRGRLFGLGGWWPKSLVAELSRNPAALAELQDAMRAAAVPLWTLNVFPFGDFHGQIVKTSAYEPDWGTPERLLYTEQCAKVGASFLDEGSVLPMSTLPLGFRSHGGSSAELCSMAANLAATVGMLVELEAETGVRGVLALEPEPACMLETVAQTVQFLERHLFAAGACPTVSEQHLRRHLGVCVDLCHLAVLDEDALAALAELRQRGIEVPKIQVSSCLEVRAADGLEQLLSFAEPRYLHQTVAASGLRSLDLDEVAQRRREYQNAGRIRTHYHVPLDWDQDGPFGSTQQEVSRVLAALASGVDPVPLLEVETYTWSVLGDAFGDEPLVNRLQRELDWVAAFWKN